MDKYTNHLPIGVHHVVITDIGDGLSSQKGTPYISVKFSLLEDADKSIVRKYYTTEKALSFFMDLYDSAMSAEEWDFPDNPNDSAAHRDRLLNRVMWIRVEPKEDQPDPEVTACRPDSKDAPFFKPRKPPKTNVTRESAQQARERMQPTDADNQELDRVFGKTDKAEAAIIGREPGQDDW